MRKTVMLVLLLMLLPAAAQMMSCELPFEHSETPTIYELAKPFSHPATLPDHVLGLLHADAELAAVINSCPSHKPSAEISPDWFQAMEVSLAENELPGLIVKAADPCLLGTNDSKLVRFWIFRQAQTGYQLVLTEKTEALQLLKSRTAGYRNVCTSEVEAGGGVNQIGYSFREGKYQPEWYGSKIY